MCIARYVGRTGASKKVRGFCTASPMLAARMWRDHPTFAQRYSATLGDGHFDGLWELARPPGDWQDDLRVTYRRRD